MSYFFVLLAFSIGISNSFIHSPGMNFTEGFLVGLHLERLVPEAVDCVKHSESTFYNFIWSFDALKDKHLTIYDKIDNLTKTIGMIPITARLCADSPFDLIRHIQFYINTFDHSIVEYLEAVALNIGWNLDEISLLVIEVANNISSKSYFPAGKASGTLFNLIFNVTSKHPIPKPTEEEILDEETLNQITDFYSTFEFVFNCTITFLNASRVISESNLDKINYAGLGIVRKIKNITIEFKEKKIIAGILSILDLLGYINPLFEGLALGIEEIIINFKNYLIFQSVDLIIEMYAKHAGYFVWDIKDIVIDIIQKKFTLQFFWDAGELFNKLLFQDSLK